jgi:hypothetical protein
LASVLTQIFNPGKNETALNYGVEDYFDYYNYVALQTGNSPRSPYPFFIEDHDDCF